MKSKTLIIGGIALIAFILYERNAKIQAGSSAINPMLTTLPSPVATDINTGANLINSFSNLFNTVNTSVPGTTPQYDATQSQQDQVGGAGDPAFDNVTGEWSY
jgi:ABC-type oligopeptide transport system substrate-binding subunit